MTEQMRMKCCPKCLGQLLSCGCLSDEDNAAWFRVKSERDALIETIRTALDHWESRDEVSMVDTLRSALKERIAHA